MATRAWTCVAGTREVAAHTRAGSAILLMRFADAVAELSDRGLQVHRSYWVAKRYMKRLVRRDGRTVLRLITDEEIPVSRTYLSAARAVCHEVDLDSPAARPQWSPRRTVARAAARCPPLRAAPERVHTPYKRTRLRRPQAAHRPGAQCGWTSTTCGCGKRVKFPASWRHLRCNQRRSRPGMTLSSAKKQPSRPRGPYNGSCPAGAVRDRAEFAGCPGLSWVAHEPREPALSARVG